MKEDVRAAREKNGFYVPHERYAEDEAEKKVRIEKIEQLENDLSHSEKEDDKFQELYLTEQAEKLDIESNLKDCEVSLEKGNKEFLDLQDEHKLAVSTLKEKEFVISKLLHSDHKGKMESENHSMVLTFGSHLDQSLKALHKTILGSVSQQQQQLRCMEEHAQLFLARKCDSTKTLESRINKITETYTSGVATLKELASRVQNVTSSDLEQTNEGFASQVMAVDHFLATAVLEAKEVIEDVQNSLIEQKQLLAFSKEQQEKGLQQSIISAQVISKATVDFFNDIYH